MDKFAIINDKMVGLTYRDFFKKVNTIRVKGKRKKFQGIKGKRKDVKKAIVTLHEGDSIDVSTGL